LTKRANKLIFRANDGDIRVADPFLIRAYLLQPYVEAADAKGVNPSRLLSAYGLRRSDLDEPYKRIAFYSFLCIAQGMADLTDDAFLGLRVGAEIRPEQVGSLGLLMSTSETLRHALEEFARWSLSMNEGWWLDLAPGKTRGEYIYRILLNNVPTRHDVEYSLANLCSLIRTRMGAQWAPREVHFLHARTGSLQFYEKIFRCQVYFEQPHNRLIISNEDLERRADKINHALRPIIEAHFRVLAENAKKETTIASRVSAIVAHELGENEVSREAIAEKLGLSVRTMQRRLAEEGVSLRKIVAEERKNLTDRLLFQTTRASITDIAIRAGYSDPSALSRAYKRWTGLSPKRRRPQSKQ
jgi:AraC-like DNA-binding protein